MTFRRTKAAAQDAEKWRLFLRDNHAVLAASGLPVHLTESRRAFDDFLMHGHHHGDPMGFTVGALDGTQRGSLIELVVQYLRHGLGDPGIDGLFDAETVAAIRRRALTPGGRRRPGRHR